MNRLLILILLVFAFPAHAQSTQYKVVATCGTASYSAGQSNVPTQDVNGNTCTSSSGGGGGGGATGTALVSFQQTCTTSAVQFPSNTFSNGFVVKKISGTGTAYIGPSGETTSTGYPLASIGEAISYGGNNSNLAYLICSDSATVVAVTGN